MIINEMIEPLVELYPQLLLKLFNNILSNNWISEDWLLSLITAIHKKGPKEDPDNYRGISLMSCMAKLFLTILNNRLTTFALENNILTHSQLGFVLGNRTSDPHIILNNIIHKYCHKRKIFLAVSYWGRTISSKATLKEFCLQGGFSSPSPFPLYHMSMSNKEI